MREGFAGSGKEKRLEKGEREESVVTTALSPHSEYDIQ